MRRWLQSLLILGTVLLAGITSASNEFYNHGSFPSPSSPASSAAMRAELDSIAGGFNKMPALSLSPGTAVIVNGGGTALTNTAGQLLLGGNFTISGAFATTLTVTGTSNLTLPALTDTLVSRTSTDTLTNKTLTAPVLGGTVTGTYTLGGTPTLGAQLNLNGQTFLNTGTLTFPTTTDILVGRATTDTLTNKTLTTPIIASILTNGGAATQTLPTSTDTLVGRATTDTLTNKTVNLSSNTLSGTTAQFNTALSDSDFITGTSFAAKGDMLVGTGAGTFGTLSIGANGTVASADSNQSTGIKYVNIAAETFHGTVRNHPDSDSVNTKIRADLANVTTNDGQFFNPAQGLIFDKTVTGSIGGMQAAAVNSTWNKLYYARKRSDGSEGLWGLRAKNYLKDQSQETQDTNIGLRDASADTKLAQGFQVATAGKVEFIEVSLTKNGSPTGNFWFTIESDSSGSPSGSVLATSDKYDASRITATSAPFKVRIPFRSPATLSTSTQYHLVAQGDWTIGANYIFWQYKNTTNPYANGSAKKYDGATWTAVGTTADFYFNVYVTQNDTALSLPSGYDQYVQIGWFYINSGGNIVAFTQKDRVWESLAINLTDADIGVTAASVSLVDLSKFVPPVPVLMGVQYSNASASTGYAEFGALTATDMVDGVATSGRYGTYVFAAGSANRLLAHIPNIPVEYQSAMWFDTVNVSHAYLKDFTW